ncbi:hypothetical protein AHGSH82_031530 [Aeromonas hydrophila]|nr:hypothetical protein AHGSH82_031530 [Aeromonas hydrophila]BBT63306.1 hypothetical protein WP8S18E02_31030 [Aeromonas hydrophila]
MRFTHATSVNYDSYCIDGFLPNFHPVIQLALLLFGIYHHLVVLATVNRISTCVIPFTGRFCGDDRHPEEQFALINITGTHHLQTCFPNYCSETEP